MPTVRSLHTQISKPHFLFFSVQPLSFIRPYISPLHEDVTPLSLSLSLSLIHTQPHRSSFLNPMAKKKKPRRRSSATSVEHASPTAPPEPARPTTSPLSPLLPQTQERPPPLISSPSPSSTHQERFPANPSDLLALAANVLERSMPSQRSAIRRMPSNIKKLQGMAEKRRERATLDAMSKVLKNMRTIEEIFRSANALVGEMERRDGGGSCFGRSRHKDDSLGSGDGTDGEDGGSTERDDGSSCGGEVGGGGGGNGGDTGAHVVRSVVVLLLVLAVLVAWVMRSWTWFQN